MSNGVLKAAVIGVGAMGRNHARVYQEMPNVKLAAVADLSERAVQEAARLRDRIREIENQG